MNGNLSNGYRQWIFAMATLAIIVMRRKNMTQQKSKKCA